MTIYVATYATCGDFDAQMTDDGGYDTVGDMAIGCGVVAAGTNLERVLAKVKAAMTAEAIEFEELTADDELTFGDMTVYHLINVSLGADPYGVIYVAEVAGTTGSGRCCGTSSRRVSKPCVTPQLVGVIVNR